jgi:sialate O-acetylesterase
MALPLANPTAVNDEWKYKIERDFPPLAAGAIARLPASPLAQMQDTPSALFNAMINPLVPYAIKGCLWYQGESNTNPASSAYDYRRLLPALIIDWRARWGEGNFPFYIVQLANYGVPQSQPSEGNWAILRESQNVAAAAVPNTGVAVLIDIGDGNNIHPHNKREAARRLTLLALNRTYGQKVEDSGPFYRSMKIEGTAIRVSFTGADGGLEAKGGPLKYFSIAGADKKFVWADARIDGDTVLVSNPQIASPVAVRYAWADNPEGCNLYNKQGLPASPFRTDYGKCSSRP